MNTNTYTTIQGDAWDLIAWKLFGDEKYMRYLIEANWDYAGVLMFSAGTVLNIPEIPDSVDEDAPFWRDPSLDSDDGEEE